MGGELFAIYTTAHAGGAPCSVPEAQLVADRGLRGDRYYAHEGTFSARLASGSDWHVTLVESEEIERYNAAQGTRWEPGSFRRNLVTRGVRLNDLVGRQFNVGAAQLQGVRLCEPCAYLGGLLGDAVVKAMAHRAGLRARILVGAAVRPGDLVGGRTARQEAPC